MKQAYPTVTHPNWGQSMWSGRSVPLQYTTVVFHNKVHFNSRIQQLKKLRIHADPNPHGYTERIIFILKFPYLHLHRWYEANLH